MVGSMAFTMVGGHSAVRMLLACGILILTAFACAPLARTRPVFRDHILDLLAMAFALVALAPGHEASAHGAHQHLYLPHGVLGVAIVAVGWLITRGLSARNRWARSAPSALIFLVGLVAMSAAMT
jgi:hypothetical protein